VAAAQGLPVPDEDADVDPEEDDEIENADGSAVTA